MAKEFVILVREKQITLRKERYNPFQGHYCTAHEIGQKARELSTEEAKAITRVREFAKQRGIVFRIRSLSRIGVKLKYGLRREEETPFIVFGKKVLQGVPSMTDLHELAL